MKRGNKSSGEGNDDDNDDDDIDSAPVVKLMRREKLSPAERQAAKEQHADMLVRQREYEAWLTLGGERRFLAAVTYAGVLCYTTFGLYICLLYGIKFDDSQKRGWLMSSFTSLITSALLQSPIQILIRALFGAYQAPPEDVLELESHALDVLSDAHRMKWAAGMSSTYGGKDDHVSRVIGQIEKDRNAGGTLSPANVAAEADRIVEQSLFESDARTMELEMERMRQKLKLRARLEAGRSGAPSVTKVRRPSDAPGFMEAMRDTKDLSAARRDVDTVSSVKGAEIQRQKAALAARLAARQSAAGSGSMAKPGVVVSKGLERKGRTSAPASSSPSSLSGGGSAVAAAPGPTMM